MQACGSDGSRIQLIAFALEDDEWMPQLRSWREFRRTYDTIYTAAELEQVSAPRERFDARRERDGILAGATPAGPPAHLP
jgi:hypothetical protein